MSGSLSNVFQIFAIAVSDKSESEHKATYELCSLCIVFFSKCKIIEFWIDVLKNISFEQ